MRKIILMRGPSGTGKSTLVRAAGLEAHHLSGDKALALMSGPWMGHDDWGIDMSSVYEAWNIVRSMIERRMSRGETIVLEGVMGPEEELLNTLQLARENRYQVMIVDSYGPSIEECLERQVDRPAHLKVPEPSLLRQFDRYTQITDEFLAGQHVTLVHTHGRTVDDVAAEMRAFVSRKVIDMRNWERIVFIGDLQGCVGPLDGPNSPVKDIDEDENSIFVFTGDLLDRGIENGETLQWAIDHLIPKLREGRAILIWGNHEDHLARWAWGLESHSAEFNRRTAPQLDAAGIDKEQVRLLLTCMEDAVLIKYHREEVILVTHGGVSGLEPFLRDGLEFTLGCIAGEQLMKGVGAYAATIDEEFAKASIWYQGRTGRKMVQVHGHRNSKMVPVSTDNRSFNLEGQAEFGGHIRLAVVSDAGWQTFELPVTNFTGPMERQAIDAAEKRKAFSTPMPIAPWTAKGKSAGCISQDDIASFANHEHIRVQAMGSKPHIATIAFNKTAFYGQVWDELTTRARGLFVNTATGEIVSRAYDKFFNVGERPETELSEVLKFKLPVKARHKYNGFLGIAGYDSETGELVLSSKSMIDGDFADMFREIALAQLGVGGLERLRRACRDQAGSAIFEVIDPVRDPHMVEYDAAHIILLDFVHRDEEFAKLDDDQLAQMGKYIGVPIRETMWVAPHPVGLQKKIESAMTPGSKFDDLHIEGLVLESADGRIAKIKTPWYAQWKRARQLGEQILLARRRGKAFDKEVPPELVDYIEWAKRLTDSQLDRPIIELRRHFLEGTLPPKGEDVAPIEEPKVNRQAEGLKRGMDALQARGEVTVDSARRLYERVTDDEMRAAFDSHPLASRIRELAEEA